LMMPSCSKKAVMSKVIAFYKSASICLIAGGLILISEATWQTDQRHAVFRRLWFDRRVFARRPLVRSSLG
jgi:hypothetical protein